MDGGIITAWLKETCFEFTSGFSAMYVLLESLTYDAITYIACNI